MYVSSCCSHPSLILKRVITSRWSSRVTTASLPAPLTFFLPLSSFAAHFWLRIFSFNSIPNAFQRASHWTTDNPEMNASANRRFLSRSQKRVCESATFELAFSHSRRQVDAPFLPHVSCVPRSAFLLPQALRELPTGQLQRQHQRLRWQAASSAWSHAHVQLQRQDDRSQPSEGRGGGSDKTNGLEKKLKLEADRRFRTTDWSFSVISAVFLSTFLHAIGPSNRMATQSLPPCEPRQ